MKVISKTILAVSILKKKKNIQLLVRLPVFKTGLNFI